MEKVGELNCYSFDEMLDQCIGVVGSEERKAFEKQLAEDREKDQLKRVYLSLPLSLYNVMKSKAESAGVSLASLTRQTLSSAFA